MKRKLLLGMFAVIGITLTASCTKNEATGVSGDEMLVTFSIGLESGINTRAISDGTGINQLHYAIFDSKGVKVESSQEQQPVFPFETSISLVKGKQYTAVFWAQNASCNAYTISDDMKSITIKYSDALNNDETRDAFFRTETFTVTDNTDMDLVLKRPFAQLNVGITEEEWNKAQQQDIVIEKSKVEIKQAATKLNLMDGSVEAPEDITFAVNAVPTESLFVDIDCDGERESYKYLSMSYFLAYDANGGASKTTLTDLKFTFILNDASEIVFGQGLANAPVQRNHRTNIITSGDNGGILTDKVGVQVRLDPLYDGEHTYTEAKLWEEHKGIYTEEALAGKTILIPEGWHIRNGYIIEPMPEYWNDSSTPLYTNPYTIDGQGNTVTFEPYDHSFVTKNAFAAKDNALVTVKNLNFAGEHFGVFGGVYGSKKYKTVFENVNIVNNGIYLYNSNGDTPVSAFVNLGEATLNNCEIKDTYWVGAEKDTNQNVDKAMNSFGGVYDVFIPNDAVTLINNSTIGGIYINNHGTLTIEGSNVDKIVSKQLVKGVITIKADSEVTSIDVNQYSDSYPPIVKIEADATIGTIQLNSIKATNIIIDNNATVGKIIWKGTEYTTIADFKNAL